MNISIPRWIVLGGVALSFFAGSINVMSLLSVKHQAVSHLTGSISLIGVYIEQKEIELTLHLIGIVFFFFFGAIISSLIIRNQILRFGKRYGFVLMLESVFLLVGYFLATENSSNSDFFISMACGLQNAMATTFSGAILRTTHMTGIVTDLGILVGSFLRKQEVSIVRLKLHLGLLAGFLLGSIFGAFTFAFSGFKSILIPIVIIFITGFSYTIFRLIREKKTKELQID